MAGRKIKPGRKVAPHSYSNRMKDQYGPQDGRDGELWTQEEKDALFEGYLVMGLRNVFNAIGTAPTLPSVTGRSERAVKVEFWKLIRQYDCQEGYLPGDCRTDRSGTPFTVRDAFVFRLGFRPEARKGSNAGHYAGLLCRSVNEVVRWLRREASRFPEVPAVVGENQWQEALRRIVSGNYPKVHLDDGLRMPK